MNKTTYYKPKEVQDHLILPTYYIPKDVQEVLEMRFHLILPIMVVMALITNSLTLVVSKRSKLKNLHVNFYIKLLATLDICYSLAIIPYMINTFTFCTFQNFTFALYHTYFAQPIAFYFRHISLYVLLNLSIDRFLAIWFRKIFQKIKCWNTKRFAILVIWITLSIIPHILLGDISYLGNSQWVVIRGFQNTIHPWYNMYKFYSIICFGILPSILLISLSIGLIIGIFKKIIVNPARNNSSLYVSRKRSFSFGRNKTADRHINLTIGVLAFNMFYVLTCVAPLAYYNMIKTENAHCYNNLRKENIKSVALFFLLFWVDFNLILFMSINRQYRKEFKRVLCCFFLNLLSIIVYYSL